jgi:hypothetical protein
MTLKSFLREQEPSQGPDTSVRAAPSCTPRNAHHSKTRDPPAFAQQLHPYTLSHTVTLPVRKFTPQSSCHLKSVISTKGPGHALPRHSTHQVRTH